MDTVVLHQFLFSHFNDKVRWALAYKHCNHQRKSYLPGPHRLPIKRLSGQAQTPVLEFNRAVVAGSAAIIEFLEAKYPQPSLFPASTSERQQVHSWLHRLDDDFGPAVRATLFAVLINYPTYLCNMFGVGKPAWKLSLYKATFPLAAPLIKKANRIDSQVAIDQAELTTATFMDEIAAATEHGGYLVGSRFSVADLTAAALIAPLCEPACADMRRPAPMPKPLGMLIDHWRQHPASQWAETMYANHRPQ